MIKEKQSAFKSEEQRKTLQEQDFAQMEYMSVIGAGVILVLALVALVLHESRMWAFFLMMVSGIFMNGVRLLCNYLRKRNIPIACNVILIVLCAAFAVHLIVRGALF